MKIFFLFFLSLLLSVSVTLASVKTIVSGRIVNPQAKTSAISIYKNFVTYDQRIESAVLDSKGNFKIEFKLSNPVSAEFIHGGKQAKIFLAPGDSIALLVDPERMLETIRFTGKGANENNLLARVQRLELVPEFNDSIKLSTFTQEEEFKAYADYKRGKLLDIVFRNSPRRPISKHFREYMITDINYTWANLMFAFPQAVSKEERQALSSEYYQFINNIKVNNDKAMGIRSYIQFINNYTRVIIDNDVVADSLDKSERAAMYLQKYYSYRAAFKGEVQSYVLAKLLVESFQKGKLELMEECLKNFKAINSIAAYDKIVTRAYDTRVKMAPGNPAPNFTLANQKGEKVSLKDFRGKVIFLDFWASWCIPCIQNQSKAQALRERYKDNVVFLNVSLDQHEASWKNMIEMFGRDGVHLQAKEGYNASVSKLFHINSVPSYWVIGRDGRLVSNGFAFMESDVTEEIEAALSQ